MLDNSFVKYSLAIAFGLILGLFLGLKINSRIAEDLNQITEIIHLNAPSELLEKQTNLSEIDENAAEEKLQPLRFKIKKAEKEVEKLKADKAKLLLEYQEGAVEVQVLSELLENAEENLRQARNKLFSEMTKIYGTEKSRSF